MKGHLRKWAGSMAVLALLATACGTSSATVTRTVGGNVTIDNESGGLWSCGFNPFNGSVQFLIFGITYESLYYDNLLTDQRTPLLATAYQWSNDGKTLTFTIRSGVTWTDGEPFTADDVVFTFNLIKQFPALDLQSDWNVLSSVNGSGSKVVMTFQQAAEPYFFQIATETPIVPQHIWTGIKDPVGENNASPIGTGPFEMTQCTPQNVTYTRNPKYWQPGLPYIQTVNYPAFTDNTPANEFLADGEAQWGGQYIPNIKTFYINRDAAHNHYWFPPIDNIDLWFNTTLSPFDNKVVRQAFAYAIDRATVSKKGENGYEPPGNQTGVLEPTFNSWVDKNAMSQHDYKFDTSKADQLLESAGFVKGSDGIYADSSGSKLSFTVISVAGYSDWDASLQVMQDNLKSAGIAITVKDESLGTYDTDLYNGNFQLAYGSLSTSPGPTPYYELRNTMDSGTTAAIGQAAAGDYGRYKNPQVDSLFDQFLAATDASKQHSLMNQIEAVMLEDVPVVPVTEGVAWYEWSTKNIGGWPTQDDPYAAPAPWNIPDWGIVLTHLYQTS